MTATLLRREKFEHHHTGKTADDGRGRDWSDAAARPGTARLRASTRSWKEVKKVLAETLERT